MNKNAKLKIVSFTFENNCFQSDESHQLPAQTRETSHYLGKIVGIKKQNRNDS